MQNLLKRVSVFGLVILIFALSAAPTLAGNWCARTRGFWSNHTEIWPVDSLTLGSITYNKTQLMAFFDYAGPDPATKLAIQLIATKLNLLRGSDPSIQPVVAQADAFLAIYPPGSNPKGAARTEANRIKDLLDGYNNNEYGHCQEGELLGEIGDRVWLDVDGDGVQDAGEAGIAGVTVFLYDGGGHLVATTVTNSQGIYSFTGLTQGTYTVVVDDSTLPLNLEPTYDRDGIATAHEATVNLLKGQLINDVDFGYHTTCNPNLLYGVQDFGFNDSQLFTLDLTTEIQNVLGPVHPGLDLESLALHPQTGVMYTTASLLGHFYSVDKATGALTLLGNTGAEKFKEVAALSFHPNGTLWAFQKNIGLMTVNLSTGALTRQWRAPINHPVITRKWDAIAWNPQGTVVYGSERANLYRWDAATQTVSLICGAGFLPDKTEALEYDNFGNLTGGWHNERVGALRLFIIDPINCTRTDFDYFLPFNDIEGFDWEVCP